MLEKYKPGITLFSILAVIVILFPPVVWETSTRILDSGFAFLFNIPKWKTTGIGGTINISQLFVELIFVFIIALLFQMNFQKIKNMFKN
jgi:uncharacterized protein involved in response to NO